MQPKYKSNWDLTLIYKSHNDPRVEADLKKVEKAFSAFAKKYDSKDFYLKSESALKKALKDYEQLEDLPYSKAYLYFHYQKDLNSQNQDLEAKLNKCQARLQHASNLIIFFPVQLAKITKANQTKFLKSKVLSPYRYYLQSVFKRSAHTLTTAEEKIINLMHLPAHTLWVRSNENLVTQTIVDWQGQSIPIPSAAGKIPSLPTPERRSLHQALMLKLSELATNSESELNAIVLHKKILDDLRHFKKPYESTTLSYQTDLATVENLVKAVSNHFPLAHRFYRLKAKMLKLKSLTYADRAAEVGETKKKISFPEAIEIVKSAFRKVDPLYEEAFNNFLFKGQIDVNPQLGKRGGAYCSSQYGLPTYILLNHQPDFNSLLTLAHELGHAFHGMLSFQHQPPLYRDYTIATAEVASTLFENFVFDEVLPTLTPQEQVVALHNKIMGSVQTIFRQVACFNFETELHTLIRERGHLTKEEMAALMNKHMKAYLGPAFKLTPEDGYFFVYWSHLRNFFYVYSYAFGELISNALYEEYKKDPKFKNKIKDFLSAGGSASPEDIFLPLGLNVRDPKFFTRGLKKIEDDIDKLERAIKSLK
ncbi:MAG: M3 family oligoendopeptidase [Candidatus Pacebacteria bacterium]|nr:M3 family oligoendopeptidase [Candidatus Paceibacterota bacterium]